MNYRTYRSPFINATSITSIALNSVLFVTILKTKSCIVARYGYLLQSFAVLDIVYSMFHLIFEPTCIINHIGPILIGLRALDAPEIVGTLACLIMPCIMLGIAFLLSFQFVYLYCKICRPSFFGLFDGHPLRGVVVMVSICVVTFSTCTAAISHMTPNNTTRAAFAPLIVHVTGRRIDEHPLPGYIGVFSKGVLFRSTAGKDGFLFLAKIAVFMCQVSIAIGISIFCSIKIVSKISSTSFDSTAFKKRALKQLFIALVAQSAVPIVLTYIPAIILFVTLIVAGDFGNTSDILFLITTLYPVVEPVVMIACIPP